MKRYLYIFLLILLISPSVLEAQVKVSGVVKDALGPLPGVTIKEKGGGGVGITNSDGKFTITLKGTSNVLIFNSIGFLEQERKIKSGQILEVVLQPSDQSLDEVVVVGYGTAKKLTNTGSVSAIKASQIREVPTSSVQNALTGKLPGFFSQQRSGQPGKDASDFFIRGVSSLNPDGNQPLIIVDDIQYTYEQLSQINVNEIESISLLKDASTTAVYGIKGANGVLVVTTRRGEAGAPKINVRLESGLQTPVKKLHFLNAYESALLVNEAYTNDGLTPKFTQADLDHFKTGDDPYGHPDVNWYDKIFKPSSMQRNGNIDISGGNATVKYFVSGGALSQDGAVRHFNDIYNAGSTVDNNYYFRRFNFRSNLDIQASKNLNVRLDITGRLSQINSPFAGNVVSEVFDFSKIHPYSAPFLNPNDTYAYASDTKDQHPTINSRLASQGYSLERRNDMNVLFGITEKLDAVTKGLSFSSQVAYASVESNTREESRDEPPSYLYDPASGTYTLHGSSYTEGSYTLKAYEGVYNNRVNILARLNYDRTFGNHHFSSLLLYNRESYKEKTDDQSSNWIPQNFQGVTFRAGYDYKQKYLIDFNGGYNGTDRFASSKRYGLFPAVSAAYVLSNERFFSERFKFVDLLKFKGSYGLTGSDKVTSNRYLYQQVYKAGSNYSFGESPTALGSIKEGDLGNLNVTWEKQKELNVGIELNMFKNRISMTWEYFNNLRYDQLMSNQAFPIIAGIGVSPTNIAKVRNHGVDGQLAFRNNIGKFNYSITGVLSYAKNKIIYQAEPSPAYPWLAVTGTSIGQPFGFHCLGFYKDQADIDNSPKPVTGSKIVPGDLKYQDLNGDGVIDQYDKRAIGKPNLPNTSFGLTLAGNYKGFSFSVLFQGTTGYSLSVTGTGIEPFQSQFQPIHQQRWTVENSASAKFPRLSTNPTTINSPSSYMSDFWLKDATYVRLKTVELGYQLPEKVLPFKIKNIRLYLSGYNLLTWTNYSLYQQDPEVTSNTAGDAYLNQRVVNFGVQIGL
ncbi:MAG: TonB-dependent receptor [Bacteroidota bacterium]|nr:TonB-dependent receptor [Bacteroidota bacterium]